MIYPELKEASFLKSHVKRMFVAAYGFEDRSLGWTQLQSIANDKVLSNALIISYEPNKGENRIQELRDNLIKIGIDYPEEMPFNFLRPEKLERTFEIKFKDINEYDEVVVDITAMTKFLILVCLCKLRHFRKTLRIVYSEANDYAPTLKQYHESKLDSSVIAYFPSQGFRNILRAKCLSSIRMQGQPVALVAFTSFNEQLVRHILGTINPYRLIFINGVPPREDYSWRKAATQFIHQRLIADYRLDNELDEDTELLLRESSTLLYHETISALEEIYQKYGMYERIIVAATGSKMQTVGLFFTKVIHPDIHIEYPTPDSYFFAGMSKGVRKVHEMKIEEFSRVITSLSEADISKTTS